MKELDIIHDSFKNHQDVCCDTLKKHKQNILCAADLIVKSIKSGGKIVFFGNGGSAADSQHLAAEFVGKFIIKRKSLAAIALTTNSSITTAIGNDFGFENVFQRQVESLVNKEDVVVAISTSGNSENVVNGVITAKEKGVKVITLSGDGGGMLQKYSDILIDVPSKSTPVIQEMHILIGHTICNLVEREFTEASS
jgi:D-sedoheptulose 7-phosphate isomerase